jgi:hypothetical protein
LVAALLLQDFWWKNAAFSITDSMAFDKRAGRRPSISKEPRVVLTTETPVPGYLGVTFSMCRILFTSSFILLTTDGSLKLAVFPSANPIIVRLQVPMNHIVLMRRGHRLGYLLSN